MNIRIKTFLALAFAAMTLGNAAAGEPKEEKKMKTIELTDSEFQKKVMDYRNSEQWKYLGDKPAIIDFYASWCGPCRGLAPVLDQLVEEYDGKIYIYKVNIEREKRLAALFGIRSIPSLLFIPKSGRPQMIQGAAPKEDLKQLIETHLLGNEK